MAYNMLDLFSQDTWNDIMGSNQPVRYNQWNQPDYQETSENAVNDDSRRPISTSERPTKTKVVPSKTDKPDAASGKPKKPSVYPCTHSGCTAKFHQLQHFKTHLASHQGLKPFKCNFDGCYKQFSQKGNLKVSHFQYGLIEGTSKKTYGRKTIHL